MDQHGLELICLLFFDMLMAKMANLDINNSEYIFLQLLLRGRVCSQMEFFMPLSLNV